MKARLISSAVALALPLLVGLAKALGRRAHDLALAGVLEQADATLGDRLTGAVDLLEGPSHGSPALIDALADDAGARVAAVDPARAAPAGKRIAHFNWPVGRVTPCAPSW